jgi:hypothetical protein
MKDRKPARTTHALSWILIAGLPIVLTAVAVDVGYHSSATSSSPATTPISANVGNQSLTAPSSAATIPIVTETPPKHSRQGLQVSQRGAVGEADGVVPDGVTVFDDQYPAVANLNPAFLGALRQAATDAARDGVELYVTSGWRSPKYQEQLLQKAILTYGSAKEAARWVDTPNTSAHVSGNAVDIGPSDAMEWLSEHGATYGLCQIYRNEPWHYELRPEAVDHGCPPMYADPTQDPRTQP